ncbi:NAD(P)/FAD-dependent oxidoreductase [Streptomyces sp. TRM64462]|uniref:flavin-containing monooxygenase n=1 Tax=Streptomyces sp. TRM64462 TaxID=2741726 RepID=UPI0015864818|nr:NAD(P)/FAD-dependent oxidoreductase [Streptomyces sp. TRM64462]
MAPASVRSVPLLGPPVYVVGAGPGGLAAAAALRARGVRAVVLERSGSVAAAWRGHYDRLRLHTTRRMSALPGLPMPRSFGRWVSRDDMVRYLEKYVEVHDLEIVTGVEVFRIDRADGTDGWLLHATGGRRLTSRVVVVATGRHRAPLLPDPAGAATWTGELRHSGTYQSAAPYAGKDVLVVGAGNSGTEIAVDLAAGGAARVRLAVRTVPHVVRRSVAGWPAQATGVLVRRLPVWAADRLLRVLQRLTVPDLSAYGLPRPATGPYARLRRDGALPVYDTGLVDAVRRGGVEPVAAVEAFGDDDEVLLADGSRIRPDAVIAATGYRRALERLVGHLGVLDAAGRPVVHGSRTAAKAPGLYFTGFTQPLSGGLRELGLDARRIARAVAATARRRAGTAAGVALLPEQATAGRRSAGGIRPPRAAVPPVSLPR